MEYFNFSVLPKGENYIFCPCPINGARRFLWHMVQPNSNAVQHIKHVFTT